MMPNIAQLDFFAAKEDIISFLKTQSNFKDYDFSGSNMNVLLDILAYNTFQNNFYTNMAVSEMFLDSAQLRNSITSHAKVLNYMPRSRSSSRAVIDVSLAVPYGITPQYIMIPPKTKFLGICGSQTFSFYNLEGVRVEPSTGGVYKYAGLEIVEGTWVTEVFKVAQDNQTFELSNNTINTGTISLTVDGVEFMHKTSVFGSTSTDKVFYLEPSSGDRYAVSFGRNVFGVQPKAGSMISVSYLISSAEDSNGVSTFAASSQIYGYSATVTTVAKSEGGAERESIDSIKYFAPRANQIQDRAVTESDYEILLKTKYPEIQAISVFGGEELSPPRFGKVVIAVDIKNSDGVSENNKVKYAEYLSDKSPVGISPIIISPDFMHIQLHVQLYFDSKSTGLGQSELTDLALNAIQEYSESSLNDFKATFRPSKLSAMLDSIDPSILSTDVKATPFLPLVPLAGHNTSYDMTFGNELKIGPTLSDGDSMSAYDCAIKTTAFTYGKDNVIIVDDGIGNLHIIKLKDSSFAFIKKNVGVVDYATGRVTIKNITISAYNGSEIKIFGNVVNSTLTAPKTRILSIRNTTNDISISTIG